MAQHLYQIYGEGEIEQIIDVQLAIGANSIANSNVARQDAYAEGRFEEDYNTIEDILNDIINDELPIPIFDTSFDPPSSSKFCSSIDVKAPPHVPPSASAHELHPPNFHALPNANPNPQNFRIDMPDLDIFSAAEVSVLMMHAATKQVVFGNNSTPEMATAANSSSYEGELYENASPEYVSSFPRSPGDSGLLNPVTDDQDSDGEIKIIVQTNTPSLHDGYTWRKYGEKRIKDQNYTRSYYRCAQKGCMIKKHTQKHTANQVIFTYRGKHNHRC